MTVHTTEGAGVPNFAPPSKSAHYLDTASGNFYLAKGTAGPADWVRQFRDVDLEHKQNRLVPGDGITIDVTDPANPVISSSGGGGGGGSAFPAVIDVASSRTLAISDAGKYLVTSDADAMTLIIPPQGDVPWAANAEIHIEQGADGAVTVEAGVGVTLQHGASVVPTTREAHSPVTLKRKAEDVWVLFGALEQETPA